MCANCADVCDTMMRMMLRMNGWDMAVMMSMMQTTIMMCRACSAECMMHAEMSEHCRLCAMACDQAVMAMEKMMGSMSEAMPDGVSPRARRSAPAQAYATLKRSPPRASTP